ncbi:MAG: cytochrome-c peroxidase [Woeseia sp.]
MHRPAEVAFDTRLSVDDSVACATCHDPEKAFTDNPLVSTGINGGQGSRNAPAVINRIGASVQFHDGRFDTLEQVVDYYSTGVIANPYLDVELRRSDLSLEETLELYSRGNRPERGKEFSCTETGLYAAGER